MRVLLVNGRRQAAGRGDLAEGLAARRLNVEHATDAGEGVVLATEKRFGAILIDVIHPPAALVKRIRADVGTPIVVLRDRHEPAEVIECFESGADDVVSEPIDLDELVARIHAISRRCEPGDRATLRVEELELNPKELTVRRAGQVILLTNREFDLLEYMMQNHDRVLSRTELADQVWGAEVEWNSNVIDVSIGRLRGKVHLPGRKPVIHTVTGRGYMISDLPPLLADRPDEGEPLPRP